MTWWMMCMLSMWPEIMLAGIDARAEHYPCYFFSIVKFLIKFAHQDVGAAGWSDERGVHGGV